MEAAEASVVVVLKQGFRVPAGTRVVRAATGIVAHLLLPDGRAIKPWCSMEIYDDPEDDPVVDNAGESDLNALGVFTDLAMEREVEDCEIEDLG
jgi:hypothetical protein